MTQSPPHYVDFEFAKFLKEKGFDIKTKQFYLPNGNPNDLDYDRPFHNGNPDFEEWFKNWNVEYDDRISRPEHWQVLDWLLTHHNLHIFTDGKIKKGIGNYWWNIMGEKLHRWSKFSPHFNSPNEAISEAFNYIRENNLI